MDFSNFEGLLKQLDLDKLRNCQLLINAAIQKLLSKDTISSNDSFTSAKSNVRSIEDTIDLHNNFIDSTEREFLMSELLSLDFDFKKSSNKVQNKFLSSLPDPYSWPSKRGPVINNPQELSRFPVISRIMQKVNDNIGCNLNSVLVSCYAQGEVNTGLHSDNEESLDSRQPICVLSVGAVRRVEWVAVDKVSKYKADYKIDPADCSLYVMKAGCQEDFLHRVRRDKRIRSWRISLSFRCSIPEADTKPDALGGSPASPESSDHSPPAHSPPTPNISTAEAPQGFSPFPQHSFVEKESSLHHPHSEHVCLLLGSSITKNVDGELLSRKSRTVINLSESGANIFDLTKIVNEFYAENSCLVHKVDRIVINIGTNDIKWLNGRNVSVFKKFRAPLCNLVKDLKFLFHNALVIFTTVLPIRALYNYTAFTVNSFNRLLYQICNYYGCIFYDCFLNFLSPDLSDYNRNLFRDKWHLNDDGLRLLCRSIKDCIYGQLFESRAKSRYGSGFYNFN